MADLKISALTASTVPLAGTEVLPIVQSSTTKQVSVANLTAGRTVAASNLAIGTGASASGFNTTVAINRSGGGTRGILFQDGGSDQSGLYTDSGATGTLYIFSNGTRPISMSVNGAESVNLDTSNNFKVTAGNVVIGTSGKGIDFSVNSAAPGATSELLDDYETGTWTPTYTPASGAFGAITYNANTFGRYTKVGNAVFIVGLIITDSFAVGTGTGQGRISGLPFTPSPSASASINYSTNFNLDTPTGSFTSGTDIFLTSRVTANGSSAAFNSANFTTGASAFANYVYFQMNFVV